MVRLHTIRFTSVLARNWRVKEYRMFTRSKLVETTWFRSVSTPLFPATVLTASPDSSGPGGHTVCKNAIHMYIAAISLHSPPFKPFQDDYGRVFKWPSNFSINECYKCQNHMWDGWLQQFENGSRFSYFRWHNLLDQADYWYLCWYNQMLRSSLKST